jgi:hypothetical protein
MQFSQDIDTALDQTRKVVHELKAIRAILSPPINPNMKPQITDHAHLIDHTKDVTLYQHASTMQLFQTINQADRKLELFIFNGGVWHSEGIGAIEKIIDMVANPD